MSYIVRAQHDGANHYHTSEPAKGEATDLSVNATEDESAAKVYESDTEAASVTERLNANVAGFSWYVIQTPGIAAREETNSAPAFPEPPASLTS